MAVVGKDMEGGKPRNLVTIPSNAGEIRFDSKCLRFRYKYEVLLLHHLISGVFQIEMNKDKTIKGREVQLLKRLGCV